MSHFRESRVCFKLMSHFREKFLLNENKFNVTFIMIERVMKNETTVKNPITVATNAAFPSLRKGKAFKALIFVASKVLRNLTPGSVHTVPLSFLRDLLKIKLSNKDIAAVIEDLEKTKVDWSAYNKKYKGYSYIVPSCRYDEEKDTITYSFDNLFVQEFLDEKTPFKNLPLDLIMGFKSNYALKIYELAFQYFDPKRKYGKTPDFAYEDLRTIFGLQEEQYNHKGHFFDRVIKRPLKEAIEMSEFYIDFHHNNRRGVFRRYWFTIKPNPQLKFDFSTKDGIKKNPLIEDEKETEESKKRANFFLEFWDNEFRQLCKTSMKEGEKELWVNPLLKKEPTLHIFTENWLVESIIRAPEAKISRYREEKEKRNIP